MLYYLLLYKSNTSLPESIATDNCLNIIRISVNIMPRLSDRTTQQLHKAPVSCPTEKLPLFASWYTRQPIRRSPRAIIESLIEIAENRASGAKDELWLCQIDPDHFHKRLDHQCGQCYDVRGTLHTSEVEKYDAIALQLTIESVIEAGAWQWLKQDCQSLQHEYQKSVISLDGCEMVPPGLLAIAGSIRDLIIRSRCVHCLELEAYILQNREFSAIFKHQKGPEAIDRLVNVITDPSGLCETEHLCWLLACLVHTEHSGCRSQAPQLLQELDQFLQRASPSFLERLNQDLIRRLSNTAVVARMWDCINHLGPVVVAAGPEPPQDCMRNRSGVIRAFQGVKRDHNLGFYLKSAELFHAPQAEESEEWSEEKIDSREAILEFWKQARMSYFEKLELWSVPREQIRLLMELMDQGESRENIRMIEAGKRAVFRQKQEKDAAQEKKGGVQREEYAAKSENVALYSELLKTRTTDDIEKIELSDCAAAKQTVPEEKDVAQTGDLRKEKETETSKKSVASAKDKPSRSNLGSWSREQEVKCVALKPPKQKTKTRPPAAQAIPRATETPCTVHKSETKPPPILYSLKAGSATDRAIGLLFPIAGDHMSKSTTTWSTFVAAMTELGFSSEHRERSVYHFKGKIKLPESPLDSTSRSFVVHKPHPCSDMTPKLLRDIGKRMDRHFCWQRENFSTL